MSDEQKHHKAALQPPKLKTGDVAAEILGGDPVRGEVAGCPTGLSGSPGLTPPLAPGEGVTDKQMEQAGEEGHRFIPEVEELKGSKATGRAR